MKLEYKILLLGLLAITLTDILGSICSRQWSFNASLLAPISSIIYGTCGFWGTKEKKIKTGILIAAVTGFFDSTIGWEISILLKANTGNIKNDPTMPVWITTIIFVTSLAALCGLIGGGLAKLLHRNKLSIMDND